MCIRDSIGPGADAQRWALPAEEVAADAQVGARKQLHGTGQRVYIGGREGEPFAACLLYTSRCV